MNKSVSPIVVLGAIAVLAVVVCFGVYRAVSPPRLDGGDAHNGQPYGSHMPPAAAYQHSGPQASAAMNTSRS